MGAARMKLQGMDEWFFTYTRGTAYIRLPKRRDAAVCETGFIYSSYSYYRHSLRRYR